jgi:RimJ/RimL family protein N-acetyltransferase
MTTAVDMQKRCYPATMTADDSLADLPGISAPRLRLRPLTAEAAPALAALTDDPAIAGAIPFLADPFTIADAQALIAERDGGRDCFLGAWRRDDDRLVGVVGTHLRGEAQIEIGYWFGAGFHGKGYASEAVAAVTTKLRERFRDREIIAECRPENCASWRVLEKAGFRATGAAGTRAGRMLLVLTTSTDGLLSAPRGGEAG